MAVHPFSGPSYIQNTKLLCHNYVPNQKRTYSDGDPVGVSICVDICKTSFFSSLKLVDKQILTKLAWIFH